jgi:hypothetical protein
MGIEIMIENWELCNSTGVRTMIGFKAGLVNCRVAAYLNQSVERDGAISWRLAKVALLAADRRL